MSRPIGPKDPIRKQRAEAVKAACDQEWTTRPGGKLEKSGRSGLKLVVDKAPEFIYGTDGEIVGVDAWVRLFNDVEQELRIDPHRRIINPPTVPRSGIRVVGDGDDAVRELTPDPLAAFWEAVWDSVEDAPNPRGWRTRGTVTTIFADAADGYTQCNNATYSTAQSGAGTFVVTDNNVAATVGQSNGSSIYRCYQGYLSFDTSSITDTDRVYTVVLDTALFADSSTVDFTAKAAYLDWGTSITSADWNSNPNALSEQVATLDTLGIGSVDVYKTWTSTAAFLTVTNIKTGSVRLLIYSSLFASATPPALNSTEHIQLYSTEQTGTSLDPKLTITHAAVAVPPFQSKPARRWRSR